jgi:broad specificity phosphatase PhoE
MRLTITRHGETKENKNGILQGHLPGTLSESGREQAKKLALRLKHETFDIIFSSDLKRAKDTTKEILKYHKKVSVFYTKELRERNLGEFEGKNKLKFEEVLDWLNKTQKEVDHLNYKPKNGESFKEVETRAKKFLENIHKKYFGKKVLIVGHGGINLVLRMILLKKPLEEIKYWEKQDNTGVDIIEIDEQKNPKVILLNCTKHLT